MDQRQPWHVLLYGISNTDSIVFGITRPAIETTIHRTRVQHANRFTTDVVSNGIYVI
jgi:hypothetical protein